MTSRTEYLNKPPTVSNGDFHTVLAKVSNENETVTFLAYGEDRDEPYNLVTEAVENFDGNLDHIEAT